jgi:uncharacterized protein YbbK (DUF523 family)
MVNSPEGCAPLKTMGLVIFQFLIFTVRKPECGQEFIKVVEDHVRLTQRDGFTVVVAIGQADGRTAAALAA